MDYERIYDNLMVRASSRVLDGYVEKHHIIPRCVGGLDDNTNYAILTPEEHYLAHLLLVKMPRYKGHSKYNKLVYAANMLTVGGSRNNKSYGWLKRKLGALVRENNLGRKQSEETIEKRVSKTRGQKRTDETRQRIRDALTGRTRPEFSEEWIAKLRQANTGENNNMFGKKHSDESRRKMSESKKGKHLWTDDQKREIGERMRGRVDTEETKRKKSTAIKSSWEDNDERKKQLSEKMRGRVLSEETKKKLSDAAKRRWQKIKENANEF
jgi:hypothetical protein